MVICGKLTHIINMWITPKLFDYSTEEIREIINSAGVIVFMGYFVIFYYLIKLKNKMHHNVKTKRS